MKDFLIKAKCFLIALGITIKKGAQKILSPEMRPGLKRVWRMFGAVLGIFARIFLVLFLILLLTGTMLGVFGAIYVTHYLDGNYSVDFDQFTMDLTSHIYAEAPDNPDEWVLLESLSGEENRIWCSYEDFPDAIIDAVVAIEDKRFWLHDGVDWKRTIGAFYNLFIPDGRQFGGSTLTQQLIKNLTQENDVTVARKIQEIFSALEVEKKYSKEVIMEWYLNYVYFGNGCYGVIAAAEEYFGKKLDELTLAECASLVGITNNPSIYNPYSNPKNNKRRQEIILAEMLDQQIITRQEYNLAKYQPLTVARSDSVSSAKIRSWYVDQAINDLTDDLVAEWGWSQKLARQYIFSGGISIYLCVDLELQQAMDDIWANYDAWPESPDAEPPESSMVIVDHTTGEIKAMIGGREKTGNFVYDLATMAKRPPGSSIKPITVYSPAFELGLINPYTPIEDMPVRLMNDNAWPKNSPNRYDGHINILQGVTASKNTVAVQVLEKVGYQRSFDYAATRFGLTTLVESKTVGNQIKSDLSAAPLALGGLTTGVTVREMTGAYSAIANNGVRNKTRTYSHITDPEGGIIFENKAEPTVAVKSKTAYYMQSCLYNAVNGSGGTGGRAKLTDMPVAGKTGTTSENKDRWFAGFTPYYTAVCWFGYTIPRDMAWYTSNPAIHMWRQVMEIAHENLERKEFEQPAGIETFTYCRDSGLKATAACALDPRGSRTATGTLDKDDVPRTSCNVHKIVNLCTVSGQLATPYCPEMMLTQKALMDITRLSPVAGFVLEDEQYTYKAWSGSPVADVPAFSSETGEQLFPVVAVGTDGKKPYNTYCELHTEYVTPSPEPTEPTDGDIPSPDAEEPSLNWWQF